MTEGLDGNVTVLPIGLEGQMRYWKRIKGGFMALKSDDRDPHSWAWWDKEPAWQRKKRKWTDL